MFHFQDYLSYDNAFYSLGFFIIETVPAILIIGFLFNNFNIKIENDSTPITSNNE